MSDKLYSDNNSFRDNEGAAFTGGDSGKVARRVTLDGQTNLTLRWDITTTPNTVYLGDAIIGSLENLAVWRISKIDTTNGSITFADSDDSFDNIWDNRAGLIYG